MAVLDHPVHKKVRIQATTPYGCYNGERNFTGYHAPNRAAGTDGYKPTWWLERIRIPHVMSRECRYDMSLTDPRCTKCKHQGTGEAYAQAIRENGK